MINLPALPFFYAPALVLSLLMAVLGAYPVNAEALSSLPAINRLDSRDTAFRQYLQDVEAARRALFSYRSLPGSADAGQIASSLVIYSYTPREGENLLGIAARCSLPYGTLASLNRLSHAEDVANGRPLLLPSVPGIFIPEPPDTGLERLMFSSRADVQSEGVLLSIPREGRTEQFRFIPGDDFSPTERVFFLNRGFRFPLQSFRVTSHYGPRINPVTGMAGVHRGLDLAAPEGSEVYAARNGTVIALGEDPVLGKYIMISHDNNWISLYAHLSVIHTALRAEVRSGNLIGRVGSTGQSTGPHLHFELMQNGQNRDPARLFGLTRSSTGR
jgi:hypothetical protein